MGRHEFKSFMLLTFFEVLLFIALNFCLHDLKQKRLIIYVSTISRSGKENCKFQWKMRFVSTAIL